MGTKEQNKNLNPNWIGKSQLAEKLGITTRQLSRWLNEYHFEGLKTLRYRKTAKGLTKSQLDYLFPLGLDYE